MKKIEAVDLKKCFEEAQKQVQKDLEDQVTAKIKAQLMAVAQLKIKANHATVEADKLRKQLESKESLLMRIENGEWDAVPDSAQERNDAAEKTNQSKDP